MQPPPPISSAMRACRSNDRKWPNHWNKFQSRECVHLRGTIHGKAEFLHCHAFVQRMTAGPALLGPQFAVATIVARAMASRRRKR